jgi:hypothetical protein
MDDTLRFHVRETVPEKFIDYMLQRQEWVYAEAYATAYRDPRWTKAEARSLVGDLERTLCESEIRKAATLSGMDWKDVEHNGKDCSCVNAFAGNLTITAHRVPAPGYVVQEAQSRKQAAAANRFMDGYFLDGALSSPLPQLASAPEIQIYLLHGTTVNPRTGERVLFMQVVAPDSEADGYCWKCSIHELKQDYLEASRLEQPKAEPVKDSVIPKIKKTKKTEGDK